tara:strand:- start:259 stop:483 length:225 start_codon:yes stop_codon:yes gene_type:complete
MSDEYKGYKIENNNFCNKVIKPVGKGSVPATLRGLYTTYATAKQAIDTNESKKAANTKTGVKKNGTIKDSSRAD